MPGKPIIWIVDISVFLNVLDVPHFNQNRGEVLADFERRINNKDTFLLPITSVIETGNHIARINNGNQRQIFARKFTDQVLASIEGESPWKPLRFPEAEDIEEWLADFPNTAQAGMGLGDHIIMKQWKEQCSKFGAYVVKIWSLDTHLQGYECNH